MITRAIGWILLASPFVAVALVAARLVGWWATLAVYGVCLGIMAVIILGTILAFGG